MEKDRLKKAAFKLKTYRFTQVAAHFEIPDGTELVISMLPSGSFYPESSNYTLNFDTYIRSKNSPEPIIYVSCIADFHIDSCTSPADIPEFFYSNSVAILFPYVRAFISTVFLQANVTPVVLPIVNLRSLGDELKSKTAIVTSSANERDNNLSNT